ncbi:hypothetical protein [Sulfurovum riftiae]|uniref:Uncharacterized protein n=1 Tax=Sulfurovum riftiae TaxID=1630136 RepID=A0A151CF78_9BACT|nr:hypothetical protein [Sulfurovum riftiae]KYJ86129.1 hypothetical protein AS592_01835 [Sulfurovum riftiae]
MKQLFSLILSLFLTVSVLNAKTKISDKQILQNLVQEVKQSKGDARRKAMNALKVKLRSMNQETRRRVMLDLQKSFAGKNHGMQNHGQGMRKQKMGSSLHTDQTSVHQPSSNMQPPGAIPNTIPSQQLQQQGHPSQQIPSSPQHFGQPGGRK